MSAISQLNERRSGKSDRSADVLYRAIMEVFAAAKRQFRLHLRPDEVLSELECAGTRGAPGFDRRKYVLLCLACASLERAESQITLRGLGDELRALLMRPLLTAADASFAAVRRHADQLRTLRSSPISACFQGAITN